LLHSDISVTEMMEWTILSQNFVDNCPRMSYLLVMKRSVKVGQFYLLQISQNLLDYL